MTTTSAAQSAPRVVVAAGTALYDDPNQHSLKLVPQALATVVRALEARGLVPATSSPKTAVDQCAAELGVDLIVGPTPGFLLNPGADELQDVLTEVARTAQVVVFYYTGHGVRPEADPYQLILRSTDPRKPRTFMSASQLLKDLRVHTTDGMQLRADQPYVLAIFDCCQSGAANLEMLSAALTTMRESGEARMWVAATARSREDAIQGRFADALVEALDEADVGTVMPYIPLSELVRLIQKRMPTSGMSEQHLAVVPPNAVLTGDVEPFFPNPTFNPDVAETLGAGLQHWLSRVRGMDDRADLGLYLTGRAGRVHAARQISEWMTADEGPGLAVVTGSPGSGKSTLLAVPVLVTGTPDTRDALTSVGASGEALVGAVADRLPLDASIVGIHARGLSADHVARQLSHQLGLPARSARDLVTLAVDEQADVVPSVLVVDGVDEAEHPADLVRSLLEPLAQHPDIKVVLGTRRNVLEAIRDPYLLIDLDSPEYQDPDALTDYIAQVLAASCEPHVVTPYREADSPTVRRIAESLASRASAELLGEQKAESFLLGRLLATAMRSRDPVAVDAPDWLQHLPTSIGEAFDEDLERRLGDEHAAGLALLTALAWSRGVGLPREGIWSSIARSISDCCDNPVAVSDSDVKKVLSRAGAYVVEAMGPGGRGVYRLFHELLSEHLRGEPTLEQTQGDPAGDAAWQDRRQQVERAITSALLQAGPRTFDERTDWELAHPYLRTHLAEHAYAAGPEVFQDLLREPDFLAVADPSTLMPLMSLKASPASDLSQVYRRARPILGKNPADNVAYLGEAAVSLGLSDVQQVLATGHIEASYSVDWARICPDSSMLTLTGHTGAVNSVSFARVDGLDVVASGGYDKVLRLWNCATGKLIGPPLEGHDGPVWSVAFGTLQGRTVLVSASWDGTVRLWDPGTGELLGPILRSNTGRVFTAAIGCVDGRPMVASGDSRLVWLWDPLQAEARGLPLKGHRDAVWSVAFGAVDGRCLLASASDDATVRMWDPATGEPVCKPLVGHAGPVWAVSFAMVRGRSLLVSSGTDGSVRLWDASDGRPVGDPLRGHTGRVPCVAVGAIGDRTLLASVGDDRTVRLWDPIERQALGQPRKGHTDRIQSVAFGTTHGHDVVITAGSDETVRLWEPLDDQTVSPGVAGHSGPVRCLAFGAMGGSQVLASAGDDHTVHLWSAVSGEPVGATLTAHISREPCIALAAHGDRCIVASGGWDEIRMWDAATGSQIGGALVGHSGQVRTLAFGTLDEQRILASAGDDGTVRLWDPGTGQLIRLIPVSSCGPVSTLAIGVVKERTVLACGTDDGRVLLLDAHTGLPFGPPLHGHKDRVAAAAFRFVDGETVLASAGYDMTVRLWNAAVGVAIGQPLQGHVDWVESLTFMTIDGRNVLLSGSADKTLRVWDAKSHEPLAALRRRARVRSLAVNPSESRLAVGEDTGVAVLRFDVSTRALQVEPT